eukprot:13674757-Alexandrium_andersonii.AAC.1
MNSIPTTAAQTRSEAPLHPQHSGPTQAPTPIPMPEHFPARALDSRTSTETSGTQADLSDETPPQKAAERKGEQQKRL